MEALNYIFEEFTYYTNTLKLDEWVSRDGNIAGEWGWKVNGPFFSFSLRHFKHFCYGIKGKKKNAYARVVSFGVIQNHPDFSFVTGPSQSGLVTDGIYSPYCGCCFFAFDFHY